MIDEAPSPPHGKLITGKELYELQIKYRHSEERANLKLPKEKEVDMNIGIDVHDLDIKLNMIKNFVEKGHPVIIKIDSKIKNNKVSLIF